MNFNLEVMSPQKTEFRGEVRSVTLPTTEGVITVLAKHMPLVAPLSTGEVEVRADESINIWSIGKGIFFVSEGNATLLIEDVTSADEISESAVTAAKEKAEEIIKSGVKGEIKLQAMYTLRKSLVDLRIARKRKKSYQ